MKKEQFSSPLSLRDVRVTDPFWKKEMELVRREVIPYQWDALNDQVEGAAPSYCMHNFKAAGKLNRNRRLQGNTFAEPQRTFRGFETLPEDPAHPDEDRFYGFVFQDSDFYKWIEAVGYSLTQHPDPELERIADEAIEIVCAAQQDDGYLDTCYILNDRSKIFTDLRDRHELYCLGHLIEGAVAYYQATGKDRLLHAARRYADFAADYFGPEEGKCKGYPGHEIAEMALVRLCEATGDQKYLDLAKYFIDERGVRPYYFDKEHPDEIKNGPNDLRYEYNQAHLPVREQNEAVGHAVRAVYLYSGMTDLARLTMDEKLFTACETLWDSVVNEKLYITGGIGGTHIGESFSFPYDLPNDTAYAETCASIGLVFWARRMLEIRPDSRYADVMEQALYNTVLDGMALDGKSFFYVNPLEVLPEACHKDERKFHVKPVRQKWFGCACCPPNLARILSSISTYAFTEKEDVLFVHLYIGSDIAKKTGDQTVNVHIASGLPWNGAVSVQVEPSDVPFTLALRLPGWCDAGYTASLLKDDGTVSDLAADDYTISDGYLYLTRKWQGETLKLDFPMDVRIWQADPRVRENIGKVAVTRGPIVYCLEEADNGKALHLLTLDTGAQALEHISVEDGAVAGEPVKCIAMDGFREAYPAMPTVSAKTDPTATVQTDSAVTPHTTSASAGLYRPLAAPVREPVRLHFIPYYTWANRGENEMSVWVRS